MLSVSSTIRSAERWFIESYLVLNAVGFVVALGYGVATVLADGSIPGSSGSPVERVLWHAVGGALFTTLTFGLPALMVSLIGWALAIRAFGHPRLAAIAIAGSVVMAGAILIPRTDALHVVWLLGAPAALYAVIIPEPPARLIRSETHR